ncbi:MULTISPECIES: hypothetical protein [unclassified Nostoc]|uniref:hypothetical protein n=1 Tax=unclassified Nostoc TaxID=2593658 RepID=UPI00117C07D6|nr:hypothetical protein [Nostoc sp. 'Peltigera membranacea cyanobiont' 232]
MSEPLLTPLRTFYSLPLSAFVLRQSRGLDKLFVKSIVAAENEIAATSGKMMPPAVDIFKIFLPNQSSSTRDFTLIIP